jgi:hypothetical protein
VVLAPLSASPVTSLAATTDEVDTARASLHDARFLRLATGAQQALPRGLAGQLRRLRGFMEWSGPCQEGGGEVRIGRQVIRLAADLGTE